MDLLPSSIKKKDLGDFFQKAAMLLESGYDICAACELLAVKPMKKGDHSADGVRRVSELLLPDLREGFSLHEAMSGYQKHFGPYINQVEVGEASGKTSEVLNRLYDQILNANKIMSKLKSAMTYPIVVLVFTFAAAAYLFTSVMPDMINMLSEVNTGAELPAMTQLVMGIGDWIKQYGVILVLIIAAVAAVIIIYAKTVGKRQMSKFSQSVPLIGKVIQNNSVALFFRSWQQMILAGAETSVALKSAAESIGNLYIREQVLSAQHDYVNNGTPVFETLRVVDCIREMELQTIHVALETGKMGKVLGILASDREFEAEHSINRMTSAINPLMMIIVGGVVGVLVMSIYGPIISVTNAVA